MESDKITNELLAALAEAQKEIGDAKKGAVNTFDQYKYATLENYLAAVRGPCLKQGLVLQSRVIGEPSYTTRKVKSGADETVCRLLVETRVLHAASGGWLSAACWGEGQDRSDKAIYKAVTGARKYSIAMLFGIYTTDDPEKTPAEPAVDRGPLTSPKAKADEVIGLVAKETDLGRISRYKARIEALAGSDELSDDDAKRCRAAVTNRIAELATASNGHA